MLYSQTNEFLMQWDDGIHLSQKETVKWKKRNEIGQMKGR